MFKGIGILWQKNLRKNRFKVSIILIMMMVLNIVIFNASPSYAEGKWYDEGIEEASKWMILPDDFERDALDTFITRGEFAEAVIRAYLSANGTLTYTREDLHFSDIQEIYPDLAFKLGIVSGYPDGTFGTDDLIRREEIFVMIGKLMALLDLSKSDVFIQNDNKGGSSEGEASESDSANDSAMQFITERFIDGNKTSPWASEYIENLVNYGVVKGGASGLLSPKSITTRAQAIILLKTALTKVRYAPISAQKLNNTLETLNAVDTTANYFVSRGDFTRSKKMNFDDYTNSQFSPGTNPYNNNFWDYRRLEDIYTPEELLVRLGNNSVKYSLVFGSPTAERYQTADEAVKHMKTINFEVWVLNSDGTKSTGRKSISINENIADIALKVFKEIYEGPEKFPIKNVGCYAWRPSATSEHRWGLAIDINSNENYMIKSDGTVVAGSFWKPGENPFSIKPSGDVVNAFKSYGFSWGGDAWSMSNDYMHFSFLGE
ncbi:S-layer homology domain-containing protein [Fusibacter bizertensis]